MNKSLEQIAEAIIRWRIRVLSALAVFGVWKIIEIIIGTCP